MKIRMDQLIRVIAVALDMVEGELLGASTNHGKRIATLCAAMGRRLGLDETSLTVLTSCALLHDNALLEYIMSERKGENTDNMQRLHCIYGQNNVETIPFEGDPVGLVLYHHERADGLGAFGKKEGEFPTGAALIAIADHVDVTFHLQTVSVERLSIIRENISKESGLCYTGSAVEAMLEILDEKMLESLKDEHIQQTAEAVIPPWTVEIESHAIFQISKFIARIIDYKSLFTK